MYIILKCVPVKPVHDCICVKDSFRYSDEIIVIMENHPGYVKLTSL